MTSMSTFTSNEQLLSFKLSLGDMIEHDGTRTGTTATYVTHRDLETGQYCLVDGFPCRITRILIAFAGKCGYTKHRVEGVGLFDQKLYTELFYPNHDANVPTVVESNRIEAPEFKRGLPPFVSWADEENVPQDDDHFVLTTTCIDAAASCDNERATTTAVWSIRKDTACFRFFLQERDAFLLREQNKQEVLVFLGVVKRQSPCTILGQLKVDVVLKNIYKFVCGEPKYRPDPESYSAIEYY